MTRNGIANQLKMELWTHPTHWLNHSRSEIAHSVHRLIACGICVLMFGCSHSRSDYEATVRDGIKSVPHVGEIENIFKNCPTDHFFTESRFDGNKSVLWNTEVFFGGRYTFTYQVSVSVDYANKRVVKTTGPAKFFLVQASRVYNPTPDTIGADFNADYKFGESDWEKVVAAHGDFSVIGVQVDTNHPLPHFDDYVRAGREPRIQVK